MSAFSAATPEGRAQIRRVWIKPNASGSMETLLNNALDEIDRLHRETASADSFMAMEAERSAALLRAYVAEKRVAELEAAGIVTVTTTEYGNAHDDGYHE